MVCNLRPAKLAGFVSNGMVLAAKGADGKASFLFTTFKHIIIVLIRKYKINRNIRAWGAQMARCAG